MTTTTESPRRRLVNALRATGALTDPDWIAAFADVPRTVFARQFWHRTTDGQREWIDGTDPDQHQRWLDVVYSDDSLVTQDGPHGTATSSSTQPSVTAMMLQALDAREGHTILEIGTGTAYNLALLCHRLTDAHLTSIDIDPHLTATATAALAAVGYAPTIVTGDGLHGHTPNAPYDRIIATCSTNRVPTAWIDQCKPGGVILANVGVGVFRLTVTADGAKAEGRALPGFAGFIEARSADGVARLSNEEALALRHHAGRTTTVSVSANYGNPDFLAWLHVGIPDLTRIEITYEGSDDTHYLFAAPDRSWTVATRTTDANDQVTQGGPQNLWTDISEAHARWVLAGKPSHDRLGLTVTSDGEHTLFVDEPDNHTWKLRQ